MQRAVGVGEGLDVGVEEQIADEISGVRIDQQLQIRSVDRHVGVGEGLDVGVEE